MTRADLIARVASRYRAPDAYAVVKQLAGTYWPDYGQDKPFDRRNVRMLAELADKTLKEGYESR